MNTPPCSHERTIVAWRVTKKPSGERGDYWVSSLSGNCWDFLKLDIQGFELEALRGGEETLRQVSAILREVSFIELYRGQCLFHDLAMHLAERGLYVCALGVRTLLGRPLLQADVLFLSEGCRAQVEG